MMNPLSKSLWISLTCGGFLTSGCTGAVNLESAEVALNKPSDVTTATVKPGAALQFSSLIDGELIVGTYSDIVVTIAPNYTSGLLMATASGTERLDVLASSAELSHDMGTGSAIWRVAVRPNDDGLHYLNIIARVSGLGMGAGTARAFSVALDPGTKSEAREDATKPFVVQSDGESLAIFDAEETMLPEE